jgi:hypothetical protein
MVQSFMMVTLGASVTLLPIREPGANDAAPG